MNEIVVMWVAVTLYALSAITFVYGTVFKKENILSAAFGLALVGLVPHSIGIGMRWSAVGHGPYLGFYETVSAYAAMSVMAYVLLVWRRPSLKVVGAPIMVIAFLLIGGAMLAPKSPLEITPTLASWWLVIHVAFAKFSYVSLLISFVLGGIYLYRSREGFKATGIWERLGSQESLDDLMYRFVAVGFLLWTVMIAAGAIWANEAWGRYWGWDPIETWSLITWLVYAIYLHVRLTLGWSGKKAAIYAVCAMPAVLFSLIGVPILYNSIHAAYLSFG